MTDTIKSGDIMAVDSTKLKESIWNLFRNLIVSNVTSVSIKGSGGANTKTVTIKNYSQAFPDTLFDNESNYTMIVINSPEIKFTQVTYRNRELDGTIEFEVFANQSEATDKISDLINSTLMTSETSLMTSGLKELQLDSTDSNHYDRNKINVHSSMLVWRYKYAW
jgi:hypothetical protein